MDEQTANEIEEKEEDEEDKKDKEDKEDKKHKEDEEDKDEKEDKEDKNDKDNNEDKEKKEEKEDFKDKEITEDKENKKNKGGKEDKNGKGYLEDAGDKKAAIKQENKDETENLKIIETFAIDQTDIISVECSPVIKIKSENVEKKGLISKLESLPMLGVILALISAFFFTLSNVIVQQVREKWSENQYFVTCLTYHTECHT